MISSLSKRTVLITTINYWPEPLGIAPYATGLAEHLRALGDEVIVVSGFPHYPTWQRMARGGAFASEVREGVRIRRRWHYVPGSQSAIRRGVYEGTFFATGLTGIGLRRRPDVILGISPALAGAALAAAASRIYRRPYGLVFQDLMGRAAEQTPVKGGRKVSAVVSKFELALAARASAVGVISEGFVRCLCAGGIEAHRIHVLRNWTHVGSEPSEAVRETRARFGWKSDEFVCLHSGSMGQKQGLENLLEAASALNRYNVRIVLAGDGNERSNLQRYAVALGLTNVEFIPVQPPGRYQSMLRAADVLLINQRGAVTDMSLASRLTSYFAAGRPIVAAVAEESETGQEVLAAGAGLLVPPEAPQALANAIIELLASSGRRAEHGAAGRRYAENTLTADAALSRYDKFIELLRGDAALSARR